MMDDNYNSDDIEEVLIDLEDLETFAYMAREASFNGIDGQKRLGRCFYAMLNAIDRAVPYAVDFIGNCIPSEIADKWRKPNESEQH
jgi:hypothetical protein